MTTPTTPSSPGPTPSLTSPGPSGSTPRRSRKWWYIGGALALVVLLAGFGIWYFIFRDDPPPAVDIKSATESLDTRKPGSSSTTGVDGAWSIDSSIGTFADFTSTFAGYRVQEELADIGAKTAVGRTPDVTGTLTIAGEEISGADFTVDMTTLDSDSDRRDGAIRDQAIETSKFPTATFELTDPITLDAVPADGKAISVDATGNLTLHGVTNKVTIPLKAQLNGDVITVTGELDIAFADYDIDTPTSFAVISVEDNGVLEVQLFFTKQ